MKKTVIAALLTLGLGTALFASGSGDRNCGHKSMHKTQMMQVIKQLDLTSDQKKAIKEIRKAQKEQRKATRASKKKNRAEMRAAMKPDLATFMTATTFNKTAFKAEMTKKFEQREQMRQQKRVAMLEQRAENMEKIFNILTPEQRNKWIQLSQTN